MERSESVIKLVGQRLLGKKYFSYLVKKPARKVADFFKLIRQNFFIADLFSVSEIKSYNPLITKIISFSLFGNDPRYSENLKKVVKSYNEILPQWKCRIYVAKDVSSEVVQLLIDEGCEVFIMQGAGIDFRYTLWRFLAIEDKNADAVIIRDLDSIAIGREKTIVEQWLLSDKKFHIIRDHVNHNSIMMAGMWGAKKNDIDIKKQTKHQLLTNDYGVDQVFLCNVVYPKIKNDIMIHDSFPRFAQEDPVVIPLQFGESFIGEYMSAAK